MQDKKTQCSSFPGSKDGFTSWSLVCLDSAETKTSCKEFISKASKTWKSNPKTKAVFPKLPKSKSYGIAEFDQSIYALSLTNFNGMTKIESNGIHRYLHGKKGLLPYFNHGGRVVSINNYFWIISGHDCEPDIYWFDEVAWNVGCNQVSDTLLWSFRTKKYSKGPKLPLNFELKYGCTLALNRTFVLFIGGKVVDTTVNYGIAYDINGLVYGYNFVSRRWKYFGRMPLHHYSYYQRRHYISCGVQHKKKER